MTRKTFLLIFIQLTFIYLHEKIKVSPLLYFDKIKNEVIVGLDDIEYGDYFYSKETADF